MEFWVKYVFFTCIANRKNTPICGQNLSKPKTWMDDRKGIVELLRHKVKRITCCLCGYWVHFVIYCYFYQIFWDSKLVSEKVALLMLSPCRPKWVKWPWEGYGSCLGRNSFQCASFTLVGYRSFVTSAFLLRYLFFSSPDCCWWVPWLLKLLTPHLCYTRQVAERPCPIKGLTSTSSAKNNLTCTLFFLRGFVDQ